MRIFLHSSGENGLLLCGVPLPEGKASAGSGFVVEDTEGGVLPAWWAERAHWPDGSIKWLFLHVRLGRPGDGVALRVGDGAPVSLSPAGMDALERTNSLELGEMRLAVEADGWRFAAGGHEARVRTAIAVTEPEWEHAGACTVEVVEASAIAPLLRLRRQGGEGVLYDQLLRLDPVRKVLHWQQRVSFTSREPCLLKGLGATLECGEETWTWAIDGAPHRRLQVLRPGYFALDGGPETEGRPAAELRGRTAWLVLEKGWQRAPFALEARGGTVDIGFYPEDAPPLTVQPGTSFRHRVRVGFGEPGAAPVTWSLDPETACASGAFGPLMARTERTRRFFPGYEQAMEACMQGGRLARLDKERGQSRGGPAALADEEAQDEEYFGLPHYGDWPMKLGAYGGERRMYADNEYDTPYAYFLQFARTGQPEYCSVGHWSAVHMADVDCKITDGDMRFHGYHQTAEDHAAHRSPGGELGHYWTDGLVLNYLLCGDLWSWEAALAQARFLLGVFAGEGDDPVRRHFLGCERAVGWPLVALAGVAEVTGDRELLAKMRQMTAFLARFTADPDRELEEVATLDGQPLKWWRVCQQDGSKPFMLGVVLEGLERYHRLTGDPAAEQAVVAVARFLVEVMWVEGIEAFIYEWNAFNRPHREDVYPHYINMMVAPGLAYAHELTGEARFRQVATRAFHAALWTLFAPGGGKEIGMVGRTSALMVGRLWEWRLRDEAARAARLLPSNGVAFSFAGSAEELEQRTELVRREGVPRYEDGSLRSAGESYAVYGFHDPVGTDRGEIAFTFAPDWDCPPHPGPVAQRAYVHLADRPFTASCVSIISFYTGLHVRFHDAQRQYVEVLETDIQHWKTGEPHQVRVRWDADEGEAVLWVDGEERDRRRLKRRLSGAFKRLHVGHRPGNWRADGRIGELRLALG